MNDIIYTESFEELIQTLDTKLGGQFPKTAFLVDSNTHVNCLKKLGGLKQLKEAEIIEVDPGEDSKSFEVVANLWQCLMEFEFNRNDVLINLGGGMITDLGGFTAGTYKRGMPFVHIPTSYTAMVDAALGGKHGINFGGAKNQVGVFMQPYLTVICPSFLNTLPTRELNAGYFETLKHALIRDADFWQEIQEGADLNDAIFLKKSADIKLEVVTRDPSEKGIRKTLNFGHTIGHALETFYAGGLLHGEAIGYGMLVEVEISRISGFLSKSEAAEINAELRSRLNQLPTKPQMEPLLHLMKMDKKNESKNINFSLLNGIGSCQINNEVAETEIIKALQKVLGL